MSDAQTVYDKYIAKFGYPPKETGHLVAFGKRSGYKIKFAAARKTMTKNMTGSGFPPVMVYTEYICINNTVKK